MPDRCRLGTNLSSSGPRAHAHAEPVAYLHFASTGLLVGLPDEPGFLLDQHGTSGKFAMREVDASGLGLTGGDFAEGVALCAGVEGESGWRCDPVDLLVSDSEGEFHSVPATAGSRRAEAGTPPFAVPPRPARPRALVYVTERALTSGALAEVAARARQIDARVVLGAVGELPESRRHAEEEARSLHRLLVDAATLFGGRVAALRVEFGGDPVHGLLTLAAEEHATLILVPDEAAAGSYVKGLTRQLRRRAGVPVQSVPHAPFLAGTAAVSGSGAERQFVLRRLTIAIGAHEDTPPWERPETWGEQVRAAVRDRLGSAAPVSSNAECSLTARWFVHPEHPELEELTRRLPVEAIAEALVNEAYVTPAQLAPSRTRVEAVETDGDLVEHVVAVLRC